METKTSSRASAASYGSKAMKQQEGAGGRKIEEVIGEEAIAVEKSPAVFEKEISNESVDNFDIDSEETSDTEMESESDEEEYEDDDDEEYDEDELAQILEDAKKMKILAEAFLHPEKKVESSVGVRCYFDRFSAPEVSSKDEADERAQILDNASALKKHAVEYMHPGVGVKTSDPTAYGRNYFNRPSAPDVGSDDEAEERAQILADAAALKKQTVDYMHPEVGVKATDPTVYGRNYFGRASALEADSEEESEERCEILAEVAAIRELAAAYLHPEAGVKVSDPSVYGRNYFDRASAPQVETEEESEERAHILADAAALKKQADNYMHPEVGVDASDPTVFGRNYFNRPSAIDVESDNEAEERSQALADAAALKKLAVDYLHPEVGVKTGDPTVFGRNYFNRSSVPDVESDDDAEETAQILADAAALKKHAVDYMHPEVGVKDIDSAVFGRNYFNMPSAIDAEPDDEAEERAQALANAAALKKLSVHYLHPEVGVKASDPTVFGRNYFNRPSAPDTEFDDEAQERAQALADAAALKKHAVDYLHPEVGMKASDPTVFGRNYFNRPSVSELESDDEAEEMAQILADVSALKKTAVDYMHPEVGVKANDPTVFGRNYSNRPSAFDAEPDDEAEERTKILADASALKKSAVNFMHPEVGVKASDPTVFGRNYFNRPSAPDTESDDEAEERVQALADAAASKKHAVDYLHPELGITAIDPTIYGRNYFDRFSVTDFSAISTVSTRPIIEPKTSAENSLFESIDEVFEEMHGSSISSREEEKIGSFGKGGQKNNLPRTPSAIELNSLSNRAA